METRLTATDQVTTTDGYIAIPDAQDEQGDTRLFSMCNIPDGTQVHHTRHGRWMAVHPDVRLPKTQHTTRPDADLDLGV